MMKIPDLDIDMSIYSGMTYDETIKEVIKQVIGHYNTHIVGTFNDKQGKDEE